MEKPRPINTSISLRLLYQWRVKGSNVHNRAHLNGTLHLETRVKGEGLFLRNAILEKMPNFLENFRPFSCEKTLNSEPPCPWSTRPLYVNQRSKELRWLVGKLRLDVFTKRVFVEKHIRGIMYENPRGARHPCPPLPTPMSRYYFNVTVSWSQKKTLKFYLLRRLADGEIFFFFCDLLLWMDIASLLLKVPVCFW